MSEADTAFDEAEADVADAWGEALAEQKQASANAPRQEARAGTAGNGAATGRTAAHVSVTPAADAGATATDDIQMILDIPVQLTVELGRTRISIKNILQLAQGSVVELEALAGEPMDVFVNGYLIAQGEVVVVNEKFGVRLTDVITPSERMRRLSRDG